MTSRVRRAHFSVGLSLLLLCLAIPAWATPKAFGQADTAWHTGELEKAMNLYQAALDKGGLDPNEVVIAYSRIGTVRAALKDQNAALSAFRVASSIDPEFELPADSGPVARKLYERARKDAEALGGERLELNLTTPETIPASKEFTVETSIPEGFAVLVSQVVVTVSDPVSGKRWRRAQPAEPKLTFEFPKRVAIRGARLSVKAIAADSKDNAWTVAESKIKVEGVRELSAVGDDPFGEKPEPKKDKKSDFFDLEGPLPWIVGGVLVVGAIVVYAATRSPDEVAIGAPGWQ
jgi:tetratricopeptide (TPR) repeat protein